MMIYTAQHAGGRYLPLHARAGWFRRARSRFRTWLDHIAGGEPEDEANLYNCPCEQWCGLDQCKDMFYPRELYQDGGGYERDSLDDLIDGWLPATLPAEPAPVEMREPRVSASRSARSGFWRPVGAAA